MKKIIFYLLAGCLTLGMISNVSAQQPRGRTVNGSILYSHPVAADTSGELIDVLAGLVFLDDFLGSTLDTGIWDTLGNVGNSGRVSFVDTTGGVMRITSGAADNDDFEMGTDQQVFLASNSPAFEVKLRNTDISGLSWAILFADSAAYAMTDTIAFFMDADTLKTAGTNAPTNAVGFLYDPDATTDNIYGVNVNAGTVGTRVNTSVAAGDLFVVLLRLEMDADQGVTLWVNGNYAGSISSAVASTAKLHPYIGVIDRGGGAVDTFDIGRWLAWSKR